MSNSKFITYENEYDGITTTNMYTMEEAMAKVAWAKAWKLKQPVDKRTRFYRYLVDQGIVEDGQTIYNKDIAHIQ